MPRITWDDLPDAVRHRVEEILGSSVVAHVSHPGGFSPGTADTVTCADGSAAFVKAVHPDLNQRSPKIHRAELKVMRALPSGLPVPRLIDGFEDDGWVVLVLENVDAEHPALPWTRATFEHAIDAVLDLSDRLTLSPLDDVAGASDALYGMWNGWSNVLDETPDDLDAWVLERLEAWETRAMASLETVGGDTLVHLDIRSDNLLVRPDGEVIVIDWPWAIKGARWLDATLFATEYAAFHADPDADAWATMDDTLVKIAARCGVPTTPLVDALVGLAGFFTVVSRKPAEPGLPTLREFQRAQENGLTRWLRHTTLL